MAKDPAFPFYAQDFLSGTAFMTLEETGAYIKLLAHQWNIGKIPKKRLGFVLGLNWETVWDNISDKFIEDNGFVYNSRLEQEREKRSAFKEKQRNNGKKGGRPSEKKPKQKPNKTQDITQNKPKQKPLEDEDEYEKEYEYKKEKEKMIFPFDTEKFKTQWQLWKVYKNKEFKFKYKSEISEQAALKKLGELSNNNEKTAIAIIHQSISEGWKGFFNLKKENLGKNGKKVQQYSPEFLERLEQKLKTV